MLSINLIAEWQNKNRIYLFMSIIDFFNLTRYLNWLYNTYQYYELLDLRNFQPSNYIRDWPLSYNYLNRS